MKRFKMTTQNGTQEFTARQYIDAKYAALPYLNTYGRDVPEEGATFFVEGAQVAIRDYIDACDAKYDDWLTKKMETHNRVRVRYGSSLTCYVWKWIPKT